jgi:hypothetical protein
MSHTALATQERSPRSSLYQLARRARFRVFMTGTMFHRQPLMVFGQFKFYDPAVFGIAFKPFKDTVAIYGGYLGKEILEYQNLEWMMDKVKPHVWIEPYVKGVEPVHREVPFHLTGRNLKYYSDMEDESIIEVGGEEVISPIVLSKHLRCQQIAGGWVKTETKYRRVGTDKLNMWRERLKDLLRERCTQDRRRSPLQPRPAPPPEKRCSE